MSGHADRAGDIVGEILHRRGKGIGVRRSRHATGQRDRGDDDAAAGPDPRGEAAVRPATVHPPEGGERGRLAGELLGHARAGERLHDRVVLEPAEVVVVPTHLRSPPPAHWDLGTVPSVRGAR